MNIKNQKLEMAIQHAAVIYNAATPVIRIHSVGGKRWKRNVAKGARIGPWQQASWTILNKSAWEARTPCLYLVAGADETIRYVGISRNRLKDRWRVSPALDAETMVRLPENQLFHSQCWKYIELEYTQNPNSTYEIRCIDGSRLLPILENIGSPLSAFSALKGDNEGIVAGVERWICNNQSANLVPWNISMTG